MRVDPYPTIPASLFWGAWWVDVTITKFEVPNDVGNMVPGPQVIERKEWQRRVRPPAAFLAIASWQI
jgi:hypothetical protein